MVVTSYGRNKNRDRNKKNQEKVNNSPPIIAPAIAVQLFKKIAKICHIKKLKATVGWGAIVGVSQPLRTALHTIRISLQNSLS